jgi:hypothetical protein
MRAASDPAGQAPIPRSTWNGNPGGAWVWFLYNH